MADNEDTPKTEETEDQATEETAAAVPVEVIDTPEQLRGGREVDPGLLDGAVERINEIYVRKGMETVLGVGRYVLDTFFDGDAANFRDHAKGHATFRQLAEREGDLHMSHVWIWRAVSIVDQLQALPEGADTQLPYTHHTLLLPVKSEKKKAKLAQKAMDEGLSKRDLEAEVRKVRTKEKGASKAGRPPLPRFVKTVHKIEKLAVDDEELWGDLEDFDKLDSDEADRLYKAVTGMKLRCERVQEVLQDKVPGFSSTED